MPRKTHKRQHYVPNCYLKAWHDKTQPIGPNRTPYLWRFDRDGSNAKRKAPENIFTENDIYTIILPDGTRDIRLEHGFSGLETRFAEIRDHRLDGRQWPDANEMLHLLAFVAVARVRTPKYRDAQTAQWSGIYKHVKDIEKGFKAATAEQRKAMASFNPLGVDEGSGMTVEDLAHLRDHPIQATIAPALEAMLHAFAQMHVAIFWTDDPIGFVTSDHPCVWNDPEAYKRPPMYRSLGLVSKSIEVTMPISPTQCIFISHEPSLRGFKKLTPLGVSEMNGRRIAACKDAFVSRSSEVRADWFQERPEPDDSWEKTHPRPKPDADADEA
jgi:hypothetical protein